MASGTKRMSDDDASLANTSKIQRIEHGGHGGPPYQQAHQASVSPHQRLNASNHDFSGSVKRKLADSKRTGQACDRCKVRPSDPVLIACIWWCWARALPQTARSVLRNASPSGLSTRADRGSGPPRRAHRNTSHSDTSPSNAY
jgi:hypothetical protein